MELLAVIEWGNVSAWASIGVVLLGAFGYLRSTLTKIESRLDWAERDIVRNATDIKLWPDRLSKLEYQTEHNDKAITETRMDIKKFSEDSRTRGHKLANELQILSNQYHDLSANLGFIIDWVKEQKRIRDKE